MSVEIVYMGNTGNHAFQYFTSFIYCKKHNLKLITKPSENLLEIFKINFDDENNNIKNKLNLMTQKITATNYDENNEIMYYGEKNYTFHDYFQNAEYINKNHIYLLKYVKLINTIYNIDYSINDNDILCILRMGNFLHQGYNSEIVHPNYFLNILENNNFNRVFFLIWSPNDIESVNKYLTYFSKYNIVLLKPDIIRNDLNLINKFKNIALSNSTLFWWGMFFCKNIEYKTIYTPKYMGYLGLNNDFRSHGEHIKNLWNIRNLTIPINHKFINIKQ